MGRKRSRPKGDSGSFTIRCGPAYRAWLERLVRLAREEKVTNFVVKLIHDYAHRRKDEIEGPPPRQT